MIRTLIIDDEQQSRENVRSMLQGIEDKVAVVGEADSVKRGVEMTGELKPDLLLLDIHLQDGLGFDLLNQLSFTDFHVIFITAHDNYAIRAIRFSAIDYILKPVDQFQLLKAVQKVYEQKHTQEESQEKLKVLLHNERHKKKKIALPTFDGINLVDVNEIIRCESDGGYTRFFIEEKKPVLVSRTLKDYEDLLSPYNFFRVHQSHLVNLNHVDQYLKEDGGVLLMGDGNKVEVSRRRKDKLVKLLMDFEG
ncbi:MAG: LytTR family DNA-binding domain-containing protein [Bacteroidales bacterium]|nr:LytTR family DNA-binding domain-containing protein [Bacteroidales bacterium]